MVFMRLWSRVWVAASLICSHGLATAGDSDTDGLEPDQIQTFAPIPPTTPQPTLRPTTSPAPTAAPIPTAPPTKVTFYAIGDVPYSDAEACMLPFEFQKMDPASMIIHLGDIRDGLSDPGTITDCPESIFQDLSTIFESSAVTPFFTPGDSGWLDCANATEAYEYWEKYLFNYDTRTDLSWSPFPTTVNRWTTFPAGVSRTTRRSELFSFLLDSILFIGVSLPASGKNEDNEWTPRDTLMADNVQWTRENLDEHKNVMSAVVVMGHSSSNFNDAFFLGLEEIVNDYSEVPVLFLEEGGVVDVEENFLNAPNLLLIETDDSVTPMKITVDASASGILNIFQYSFRCACSNGHRPTQLITYAGDHSCAGQCDEEVAACASENPCSPEGAVCP